MCVCIHMCKCSSICVNTHTHTHTHTHTRYWLLIINTSDGWLCRFAMKVLIDKASFCSTDNWCEYSNISNPITGIGCCTWFDLDYFAGDVFTSWLTCVLVCFCACLLLFLGGGRWGETGKRGIVRLCVCGCRCACVWMQGRKRDQVRCVTRY